MNLLSADTDLGEDQYRIGFNLRNRYDNLEPVFSSVLDTAAPQGIMQECVTFGNYVILFVGGNAFYRLFNATGWKRIVGFQLSSTAPRLWTCAVPISTTNYVRLSNPTEEAGDVPDAQGGIRQSNIVSGTAQGNSPGLLVQDNINQPQFIFLNGAGLPIVRITRNYAQWRVTYDTATGAMTLDRREYAPIGNCMAWVDGILYVVSRDFNSIYRSVSGRSLDFVVNVTIDGQKGGNADTTSYSVGVGGISCIRPQSDGSLFVAASNANFSVAKNTTPGAPTLWGEYTFIRKFLFNATCMSDRTIIDSIGDTRFISLTGIRSFNAILQTQNEGRNVLFTSMIQSVFSDITQSAVTTAAILYDNYEYYGVDTIFGPALAVYDTVNQCWSSFDLSQTGGSKIKILAKIELSIQRLFAVTEDNKFYTLHQSTARDTATVRTGSYKMEDAELNCMLNNIRVVLDNVTENVTITATPIVDNRYKDSTALTKTIRYSAPVTPLTHQLPDINTGLYNAYWTVNNVLQGWKTCCIFEWTGSSQVTQYSMMLTDKGQMNPLPSQQV